MRALRAVREKISSGMRRWGKFFNQRQRIPQFHAMEHIPNNSLVKGLVENNVAKLQPAAYSELSFEKFSVVFMGKTP